MVVMVGSLAYTRHTSQAEKKQKEVRQQCPKSTSWEHKRLRTARSNGDGRLDDRRANDDRSSWSSITFTSSKTGTLTLILHSKRTKVRLIGLARKLDP